MIRAIAAAGLLTLVTACVQPGSNRSERPFGCDAVARYMRVDPAVRARHDYDRLGGYTFMALDRESAYFPVLQDEDGTPNPEIEQFIAAHKDQSIEAFQMLEPGDVPCNFGNDEVHRYAEAYNRAMLAIIALEA